MVLLSIDFESLHLILRNLFSDMMVKCSDMVAISKGIAGLGALFYVATRVWQSLSRAEPIDVYPLLRPFALGLCIMCFPLFLGIMNGVLSPIVVGTNQMLQAEMLNMDELQAQKNRLEYESMKRNPETAYLVDSEEWDKKMEALGLLDVPEMAGMYIERGFYDFKNWLAKVFREFLELLFNAAALVIDTLRTFFLIVLCILGPLAFAISCWDGFQSTMTQWLSKYISVYLWLPVADLFSVILARIQSNIIATEIVMLDNDPTYIPDGATAVYVVFMIIGIIGYFTIPTVANWIIAAGGMGNLGKNVNAAAVKGGAIAGGIAGAAAGNIAGRLKGGGGGGNYGSNSGNSSNKQSDGNSSGSSGPSGEKKEKPHQ